MRGPSQLQGASLVPALGLPPQQPCGRERPGGVLVLRRRPAASRPRDSNDVRRGKSLPECVGEVGALVAPQASSAARCSSTLSGDWHSSLA